MFSFIKILYTSYILTLEYIRKRVDTQLQFPPCKRKRRTIFLLQQIQLAKIERVRTLKLRRERKKARATSKVFTRK